jgi:hypothetical protein
MHLKIWCDGEPNAPIVVVIPGFMNETDIENPLKGWTAPTVQFARTHMFSAGGIYWDSKSFTKNEIDSLSLHNLQNGVLNTWRAARKEADRVAKSLDTVLNNVDRPVILVGHSLGARIALLYASQKNIKPIQSIYALAPAVSASEIDASQIENNVEKSVLVGYSRQDLVLQCLYPIGRNKGLFSQTIKSVKRRDIKALSLISRIVSNHVENPPIGCVGLDTSKLEKTKTYEFSVHHTHYCQNLFEILSQVEELL